VYRHQACRVGAHWTAQGWAF